DVALGILDVPVGLDQVRLGGRHRSARPEFLRHLVRLLGQQPPCPEQQSRLVELDLELLMKLPAEGSRVPCQHDGGRQVSGYQADAELVRGLHVTSLASSSPYSITIEARAALQEAASGYLALQHVDARLRARAPLATRAAAIGPRPSAVTSRR